MDGPVTWKNTNEQQKCDERGGRFRLVHESKRTAPLIADRSGLLRSIDARGVFGKDEDIGHTYFRG